MRASRGRRLLLVIGTVVATSAATAAPSAAAQPVSVTCGNGVCVYSVFAGVAGLNLVTGRGGPSGDVGVLIVPEIDPLIGPGFSNVSFGLGRGMSLNQFTTVFIGQDGGVGEDINAATGSGTITLRGIYDRENLSNGEFVDAILDVDHSLTLAAGGGCAFDVVVVACAGGFGEFTPTASVAQAEVDPPIGPSVIVRITYRKGQPVSVMTNPPLF